MREDFRCVACGYKFQYDFNEGKEKTLHCPRCKQLWKIKQGSMGAFRLSMWI
jgi:predicted Zn-ribbon and HTH transcriptional regulator